MPSNRLTRHSSASERSAVARATGSLSTRWIEGWSNPGFITRGINLTPFARAVVTTRGSTLPVMIPFESITKTWGDTIEIWSAWARNAWMLSSPRRYQSDSSARPCVVAAASARTRKNGVTTGSASTPLLGHHPKTMVAADLVDPALAANDGAPARHGIERGAPEHSGEGLAAGGDRTRIGASGRGDVPVLTPFLDVAPHIVEPERIGRLLPDRMGLAARVGAIPADIADGVAAGGGTAPVGVFPLRLAGQSIAEAVVEQVEPGHEGLRVVPGDLLDRAAAAAGLEKAGVVPHHGLPLRLGDGVLPHVEAVPDGHLAARCDHRAALAGIAPHLEAAGRNRYQLDLRIGVLTGAAEQRRFARQLSDLVLELPGIRGVHLLEQRLDLSGRREVRQLGIGKAEVVLVHPGAGLHPSGLLEGGNGLRRSSERVVADPETAGRFRIRLDLEGLLVGLRRPLEVGSILGIPAVEVAQAPVGFKQPGVERDGPLVCLDALDLRVVPLGIAPGLEQLDGLVEVLVALFERRQRRIRGLLGEKREANERGDERDPRSFRGFHGDLHSSGNAQNPGQNRHLDAHGRPGRTLAF